MDLRLFKSLLLSLIESALLHDDGMLMCAASEKRKISKTARHLLNNQVKFSRQAKGKMG